MSDGYPTEEELERIRKWPATDLKGLFDFIKPIWNYSDTPYWRQRGRKYWISTVGWSGNESIIGALEENFLVWALCWMQSQRGGHYIFELPEPSREGVKDVRKPGGRRTR